MNLRIIGVIKRISLPFVVGGSRQGADVAIRIILNIGHRCATIRQILAHLRQVARARLKGGLSLAHFGAIGRHDDRIRFADDIIGGIAVITNHRLHVILRPTIARIDKTRHVAQPIILKGRVCALAGGGFSLIEALIDALQLRKDDRRQVIGIGQLITALYITQNVTVFGLQIGVACRIRREFLMQQPFVIKTVVVIALRHGAIERIPVTMIPLFADDCFIAIKIPLLALIIAIFIAISHHLYIDAIANMTIIHLETSHHPAIVRLRIGVATALIIHLNRGPQRTLNRLEHVRAPNLTQPHAHAVVFGGVQIIRIAVAIDVGNGRFLTIHALAVVRARVDDDIAGHQTKGSDTNREIDTTAQRGACAAI